MSADTSPFFTPGQRRAVGNCLTILAVAAAVAVILFALIQVGRVIGFFSSVLWPLAVAGILALILRPIVTLLEKKLKLRRLAAVILLYGVFVLLVAGALVLAVPPLVDQVLDFINYAPTLADNVRAYGQEHYPQWVEWFKRQMANPTVHQGIERLAGEMQSMLASALPSLRAAGGGLLGLLGFLTHVAIIPVYLFFFLLLRGEPVRKLKPNLPFLSAGVRDDVVFLAREFVTIIESFFRGQVIIGLIMGVLYAAGFSLIGLKFGLVVGLVAGLLNIIPYLGTIIGLGIALPLAFFQPDGGGHLVLLVLLVKLIVQVIESWFLTPKIMGERTGLHPVVIIIAIFFWGEVFHGVLGMLLAIPLTAFFVTAWRLVRKKYLNAS